MNQNQLIHFAKLKKRYAYELAVDKKTFSALSPEDLYESLALLDLSNSLVDTLNEFVSEYESTTEGGDLVCILTTMASTLNKILASEATSAQDRAELKIFFDGLYESIEMENSNAN